MRKAVPFAGLLALSVLAAACGEPSGPPQLSLAVRTDAALRDDVTSLSVFVLGPKREDGVDLTCTTVALSDGSNVAQERFTPTDGQLELVRRVDATLPLADDTLIIDNLASGRHYVLSVEAVGSDPAGQAAILAWGCADYVPVTAGETTDVDLRLLPI